MNEEEYKSKLNGIADELGELKKRFEYITEKAKEREQQEKAAEESSAPENGEISAGKADGV